MIYLKNYQYKLNSKSRVNRRQTQAQGIGLGRKITELFACVLF